ncbi:MAG: hypothetical protein ACKVQC_09030 [Elusimicrobiota bacterium]
MNRTARKIMAVFLTLIYSSTQVVFASKTETSFWEDRKPQVSQLASLPNSVSPDFKPSHLLNQLPNINPSLSVLPKWTPSNTSSHQKWSHNFQSLIDAIPLNAANIQDIYFSQNNSALPTLTIQDVHLNAEAQFNIASVLQELIQQNQISLIGVEGAFTELNFTPFSKFKDKRKVKEMV